MTSSLAPPDRRPPPDDPRPLGPARRPPSSDRRRDPDIRGALRAFHAQSSLTSTFVVLTGALVLTVLARYLGLADGLMGFVTVLPGLAGALVLPLTGVVGARPSVRRTTVRLLVASRLAAAGLALVPLMGPGPARVVAFFAVALTALTLHAQATACLNSWMFSFVADGARGAYSATRLTLGLCASSALSLATGWFLDHMGAAPLTFAVVFLLAGASAILEVGVLSRVPDGVPTGSILADGVPADGVPTEGVPAGGGIGRKTDEAGKPGDDRPGDSPDRRTPTSLGAPLRHRPFMALTCYVALFYVALLISDSYTYAYLLGGLELSATTVSLFGLLGTVPQVVLLRWWGRRSDRTGHARVLRASVWFFALETAAWAAAGRGAGIAWVPVAFAVASVANSSFAVAVLARRYELMPRVGRVAYEAMFTAVTALAALAGPALGGVMRQALQDVTGASATAPARIAYGASTLALVALQLITSRRSRTRPPGRTAGRRDRLVVGMVQRIVGN